MDYGESLEQAAMREAFEETGLKVSLKEQLKTYSAPNRDSRFHTISTVFIATAEGCPRAGDDASKAEIFMRQDLPPLAFDHAEILSDYFIFKKEKSSP